MATTSPHAAGRPDGQAEAIVPTGRLGRRGGVYTLLKDAGERGLTQRQIAEAGIPNSHVHVESLRHEGHGITVLQGRDERDRRVNLYVLTSDAWEVE